MPMIPEAAYAMLACARIGASIRSCSAASRRIRSPAASRIASSTCVITADEGLRGGKTIPLKANVDAALDQGHRNVGEIRARRAPHRRKSRCRAGRDHWYDEDSGRRPDESASRKPMNAEDPLFILYTSGSTGKPKGVLHTTGGYLVYASMTHEYVFDLSSRAMSTGAPPMSAGSPATATSSTARSRMARRR
jgi:acetyl-CoA synthetase